MLFSYTLPFFVLAASVLAAPLVQTYHTSQVGEFVPLTKAHFLTGIWMRAKSPADSTSNALLLSNNVIPKDEKKDDEIEFTGEGSELFVKLTHNGHVGIPTKASYLTTRTGFELIGDWLRLEGKEELIQITFKNKEFVTRMLGPEETNKVVHEMAKFYGILDRPKGA